MTTSRPNLFSIATSELSQDAFLCWLLSWADGKYAQTDPALHAIGRDLLGDMFVAGGKPAPEGELTVRARRQVWHIDIVVEIGSTHVLVIEDKVHASEHSEQLDRYKKTIAEEYPGRTAVFLYLKTGDQSCYEGVKASGWTTYLRAQLLQVLQRGRACTNAIYQDFREHLEAVETAVQRYLTVPPGEWTDGDAAYVGLYKDLKERLGDGDWRYVANPSGGFMGFAWHFLTVKGGEVYLQLEETALVAKIWVKNPARRGELRNLWSERVVQELPEFARPAKFGHGEYMTVATRGDYRVRGSDGRLDIEATARRLREVTAALSQLVDPPS